MAALPASTGAPSRAPAIPYTIHRDTIIAAFSGVDATAVAEAFVTALPELEFKIPGHFLADAAVVSVTHPTPTDPRCSWRWNCC